MLFSLCACSGDDIADSYGGTWIYDTGKGNVITYHFNKGGIGYYEQSLGPYKKSSK